VSQAVAASSCIPPFFKPVVIDGQRYVDGAFSNSIPADLVKQMGADYIVGIDLKDYEPKQGGGILSMLFPTYKGKVEEPWAKGYEFSNVVLHPDLRGYTSTSFRNGSEMYDIGYKTAIEQMPKIKQEIERLKMEFVSDTELKDAQERLKGGFIIALETNAEKASNTGNFEALGFGYDFLDTYIKMIDEVTASDIIRVANKYFNDIYVESTVK
jgi:hypothetical protein